MYWKMFKTMGPFLIKHYLDFSFLSICYSIFVVGGGAVKIFCLKVIKCTPVT